MAAKSSEWRPGPTVCRCCLSEGCYKDISTEYFWMGKREVYAEMLSDTFDITIAYSQSGGPNSNSRLICEPCISRLRDASEFKRQVLECEKTFIQHLDPASSSIPEVSVATVILEKEVKLEPVKLEKRLSVDDFDDRHDFGGGDDDDDDDLDDQPLTKLASKVPKKESVDLLDLLDNAKATEKRKSTSKLKTTPAKKSKTKKESKLVVGKSTVKPEKKKKDTEVSRLQKAKRNAEVVLQYSTVYPFRLRGKSMLCVYCHEKYEDPDEFRRHLDENHQIFTVSTAFAHCAGGKELLKVDCTDLKCRLCELPFEKLDEIARHVLDSHDVKNLDLDYEIGMQPYRIKKDKWMCYLCNKKLPSITKLCRHTASHYQKYTCDICGRNYMTIDALKYHIKISHSANHVCRKCWEEFPSSQKKKEHLKTSRRCWAFCCISCGERFMSWETKQKHLITVHGHQRITYKCPECREDFHSRRHFYSHYKLNHTDESFTCSCCGLKFGSKKELEGHRVGHTGEKKFKCMICLKSFSRNNSLTQHMWLHSDTKRFACVICNKPFAQKVSLKGHMKSHHPDVPMDF